MKQSLTPLQEKFCLNYLLLGNATQAVIQAGYSRTDANNMAWANLQKPHIQARIAELWKQTELTEKDTIMTVQERKERLSAIGRADEPHDPMKAIDMLNKMEKMYAESSIFQDNRQFTRTVNIVVVDQETKDLIERAGERTKLLINGSRSTDNQGVQSNPEGLDGGQETG